MLDTLAVAYAAVGNFPKAIETAEQAVALIKSMENNDFVEQLHERLELYRQDKAHKE